jgi:ATP-dependent Zn protease
MLTYADVSMLTYADVCFLQAKKQLPCIVFLDEIDAIGSSRSMTDQQSLRQTLNQILTELDGTPVA